MDWPLPCSWKTLFGSSKAWLKKLDNLEIGMLERLGGRRAQFLSISIKALDLAVKPFQTSPCTSWTLLHDPKLMSYGAEESPSWSRSWPTKLWALIKCLFSATEFEVVSCTTIDNCYVSVGFMRTVLSRLTSVCLTWAHNVFMGQMGAVIQIVLS